MGNEPGTFVMTLAIETIIQNIESVAVLNYKSYLDSHFPIFLNPLSSPGLFLTFCLRSSLAHVS
jgi:hypothetical protein